MMREFERGHIFVENSRKRELQDFEILTAFIVSWRFKLDI